jgi:hypothetical protein
LAQAANQLVQPSIAFSNSFSLAFRRLQTCGRLTITLFPMSWLPLPAPWSFHPFA